MRGWISLPRREADKQVSDTMRWVQLVKPNWSSSAAGLAGCLVTGPALSACGSAERPGAGQHCRPGHPSQHTHGMAGQAGQALS